MTKYYYGLLFSLLACLLLSLLFCPPFDLGISDKAFFTYTGWAVAHGQVPYRDFFDHKPPLIYLVNYLGIGLGGIWGLWFLDTVCALVTTAAFYNCCNRYRLIFPWLLPLLFNLMLRDQLISEGINMTREYTCYCYILFFCVLMGRSRYRSFLLGLWCGLAFFMQQEEVLPMIPFLGYALLTRDPLTPARRLLLMATGFVTVALPIVLYFAAERSLGDFWRQAFLFNLDVYTAQKKPLGDHFRTIKRVLDSGNYELPFMISLCLGVAALIWANRKRGLILAAFAGLLVCFISEFMGGRYRGQDLPADYPYYFLPLSAGVSILLFTVFAFAEAVVPDNRAVRLPYTLLLCASLGYTALQHATHLRRRDRDPVIASAEMNYLRQHPPENDQLYVFQNDDYISAYYAFRILSPSKWVYQHFWTWYDDWDPGGSLLRSIAQDLLTHHTRYVIMDPSDKTIIRNAANYAWWMTFMNQHYQQVPLPGRSVSLLWQRKDN